MDFVSVVIIILSTYKIAHQVIIHNIKPLKYKILLFIQLPTLIRIIVCNTKQTTHI
jgi:hypothetical protein